MSGISDFKVQIQHRQLNLAFKTAQFHVNMTVRKIRIWRHYGDIRGGRYFKLLKETLTLMLPHFPAKGIKSTFISPGMASLLLLAIFPHSVF